MMPLLSIKGFRNGWISSEPCHGLEGGVVVMLDAREYIGFGGHVDDDREDGLREACPERRGAFPKF